MRYAEPPVNPPESRLISCPDCDGEGQTFRVETAGSLTRTVHTVCMPCEGLGEVEPDPYGNGYDTVKEAEGWA